MQTYQGEVCHSTTPPSRNGVATPRRIVRSLRAPPSCVTALVKLDSGTNDNGTVLNGTLNGRRLPHYPLGDFSEDTEDVGSEICSIADDQDISITSIPALGAKKTPSAGVMYSGPRGGRFHQRTGSNQIPRRFASCPRSGNANSHNLMSSSGASAEVDLYTDLALSVQSSSFSFHSHDPAMIEVPLRSPNTPINDSFDSANMLESVPSCSLTVLGQSDAANSFPASNTGGGACAQAIARRSAGIRGDHGITESGSSRSQCGVAARHDSKTIEAANAMTLLLAKQSTSDSAGDPRDADEVTLPPPSRQRESLKTVPSIIPPAPPAPLPCLKFADDPIEDESGPVWRVQRAKKLERIGRGSYGDVYRGLDLDTNKVIAIKEIVISKDFTKDMEKQIQALEREVKVMRKLNHKNTVRYLGAARDEVGLSIFMEYIAGGSIGTYLAEKQALSEAETRSYTSQLLCGLEYLHARHILHRDLKGDNLFLTEDNVLKLGDFGTSKELVTTVVTDSIAGTPNFMAPEIIACSGHSYEADIWSVGCCVLEMLTGKPPFRNMDNHMAIMFAVMKGKIEEQVPAHISSGAKNFIKMCTMPSPKDRWTATQLRHHYWLLGEEDPAGSSVGAVPDGAALPSLVPTTSTSSLSKKQVPAQLDTAALENKAMVVSPDNSSKTGGISNSNPSSMEESPCKITPKCTPEMPKVKDAPSRSRSRKTSDEGVKGESRSKHSKGSKSSKHRNSDDASRAGQSNTTPSLSPARPSAGTSSTTDAQHTPSPPSGKGSHSHHSHHSHHRGKDASGTEKLATNSMASTARLPPGDKPCTFPQPATPPSGANKVAPTEERGRRRPRGIPSQSRGSKPKANLQVAS